MKAGIIPAGDRIQYDTGPAGWHYNGLEAEAACNESISGACRVLFISGAARRVHAFNGRGANHIFNSCVGEAGACRFAHGVFCIKRRTEGKDQGSKLIQKDVCDLAARLFAHQPALVLEEPYFYLEEQDRRQFKRVLDDLSADKQIIILTSNLEDALISCDVIYRLNESGFHPLDIRDSEEDKQDVHKQDEPNITLQKISTKRNDKVILFNPPEIDFIESVEGSILVHVGGENYDCALTLTELEQRLLNFGFFRCHRSYIVNLQKVREIITWTKNSYSLRLNTSQDAVVPLSRSKLQELKALLNI